ncbi:MAG: class I SAM-dependent methyltransferase [Thermodesulfobacteriota bacterium]
MSDISLLTQIAKIRNFEKGHRAAQVLNTGFRSGILTALDESPEGMTVPELALKLMLYAPFVKIWCQTAYHFDLLDGDETGRFKLQPYLEEVLGLDQPFDDFSALREKGEISPGPPILSDDPYLSFMRTGRFSGSTHSPMASFAVSKATKTISTVFFSMIFPDRQGLEKQLEQGCNLLDIGCGSGQLLLDLARRFPNSRFVGADPDPYGIEKAEEAIVHFGLEDHVQVENRGGEEIDFSNQFDLALLVLTLHEILPEVRQESLIRINRALKNGGKLLILDYPYPGQLKDFRNPRYEYGIIEQYFEALSGIVHIDAEAQETLLSNAGFKDIERTPVAEGGLLDLILTRK